MTNIGHSLSAGICRNKDEGYKDAISNESSQDTHASTQAQSSG